MYNGWRNRVTWLVYSHLTNDAGAYEEAICVARQGMEALREYVEDLTGAYDGDNLLAEDILRDALDDVAWEEIAEALLEE